MSLPFENFSLIDLYMELIDGYRQQRSQPVDCAAYFLNKLLVQPVQQMAADILMPNTSQAGRASAVSAVLLTQ